MTTIKSFTDFEQSKRLAEFLPLKSADMRYELDKGVLPQIHYFGGKNELPCWSLTALLDVIPDSIYDNTNEFSQLEFSKRSIAYHDLNDGIKIGSLKDNLIDACYELILKLHELNLL